MLGLPDQIVDRSRQGKTQYQPHDTAQKTDKSGFQQKQGTDIPHIAAQHLHYTDLLCPLVNGHHHRIGDTDRRHKQRYRADAAQHCLYHAELLLLGLDPFRIIVSLISQIRDHLSHLRHMLHLIHIDDQLGIENFLVGFSLAGGGLPRDRPSLELLFQHRYQFVDIAVGIPAVRVVLIHAACRHAGGSEQMLFGFFVGFSVFVRTAALGIIVGVPVQNIEDRVVHQIDIRQLVRLPVAAPSTCHAVKIRQHHIAEKQLQFPRVFLRKRTLPHIDIHIIQC